jgi:hypothetical protein
LPVTQPAQTTQAVAPALPGSLADQLFGAFGDSAIGADVLGSRLSIRTSRSFAGAVTSLQFRGREYIDNYDHGRQLQSAASFDRLGECYNPTEAGSRNDGYGPNTTSRLLRIRTADNWLETDTDMAFWLPPGENYRAPCGERSDVTTAVNTTRVSGHVLKKRVEIGYQGLDNVIAYNVSYNVPEARTSAIFEAATIYTPPAFSRRLVFDPVNNVLSPTSHFGEQSLPVLLATQDGQHAVGMYSFGLPQNGAGYGTFGFADTNKLNCVYRVNGIVPGAYGFQCLVIVGTQAEVVRAMTALQGMRP